MAANPGSLDFSNTAVAFRSLSTTKLRQAYRVFQLFQVRWLVRLAPYVAEFSIKSRIPIGQILNRGIFRHFCGGETIEECIPLIDRLAASGVGTILDFATEHLTREDEFERTLDETLRNIALAAQRSAIPYCVFKPSALAANTLLERISSGAALTPQERDAWQRALRRFDRVAAEASKVKVRLLIDAEESWIQEAIDVMALELMRRYNREDVILFNTVQMYRKDRTGYVLQLLETAEREGFKVGLKVVRGAYLEKERLRAERLGYPSPIHDTKEATDRAYDEALKMAMTHFPKVAICAGTHNEQSTRLLARLLDERGVARDDERVQFSQLLGMSDHLTYNLAAAGYRVGKYTPYGRMRDLLPYLTRRAQENSSIQGQSARELLLIRSELQRRAKAGDELAAKSVH